MPAPIKLLNAGRLPPPLLARLAALYELHNLAEQPDKAAFLAAQGAGFGEQHLWGRVAVSVFADLGAQLSCDDTPGGGEAEVDLVVGVLAEQFAQGLLEHRAAVVRAAMVAEAEVDDDRRRLGCGPATVSPDHVGPVPGVERSDQDRRRARDAPDCRRRYPPRTNLPNSKARSRPRS